MFFFFRSVLAIALVVIANAANAQDGEKPAPAEERIISAEEFESFVAGTTLYFNRSGQPYGAEEYMKDRRVIWTFLDGTCERGAWHAEEDQICFVYETQSGVQCWHFIERGGQKRARVIGDSPANDLFVVGQNNEQLTCQGPDVGVSYTPAPPPASVPADG